MEMGKLAVPVCEGPASEHLFVQEVGRCRPAWGGNWRREGVDRACMQC